MGLMDWWAGRRLEQVREASARVAPTPLAFPTALNTPVASVRADIEVQYGSDDALERPLRAEGSVLRTYMLERAGAAALNVSYMYRASDGIVWAIRIQNAAPAFSGTLGDVSLNALLPELVTQLGPPTRQIQQAPIICSTLWLLDDRGYAVDSYSETYDDIGGFHHAGEIRSVECFARDLAPEGYRAGFD
jgi:hypothetical protein